MRIKLKGKNYEILTDTSANQITAVAIIGIVLLVAYALSLGYNGVLTTSTITIIAGLGGYRYSESRKTAEG